MKSYVVALSGASGAVLGVRLVRELLASGCKVYICLSRQAFFILNTEAGIDWAGSSTAESEEKIRAHFGSDNIYYFSDTDLAAPFSSGSFITGGMFVVPCSMKTLSGIAHGYASNLIERAADVTIKEGRKLIIAPREMPFSAIHLENMLKLARIGVTVAPPVPAFYQGPEHIEDIISFIVGKLLDSAGVKNNLFKRWNQEKR
ncbi:MAG: UbiX family flavin prenyltransferase [Nitrospira sp.]|nr:UbiX family flavin prenyltransferase [bacterium]MBL7048759.1 UbiX family flavin prenyltransferase [Nitrospira sp.]